MMVDCINVSSYIFCLIDMSYSSSLHKIVKKSVNPKHLCCQRISVFLLIFMAGKPAKSCKEYQIAFWSKVQP